MMHKRLAAAAAALAATALILAGCGNGSNSKGSNTSPTGASSSSAGDVQKTAQAKVAEFMRGPTTYPGPTEAFNPGTGKAAAMACGFGAPVCADQAKAAVEAIKAMGWDAPPPFDGQFSPQVQSGFLDRAVQDKLDGVILVAVDVNTIKASTDRAVAAGLTIMCVQCLSGPQWAGKVHDVTADFYDQGKIAAWRVLAKAGGKAKVAVFSDSQFSSAVQKAQGVQDGITQNCPGCTVDVVKFAAADAAKPGPPQFTSLLASHPKGTLDYVIGHYDGLSVIMTKTAQNAGRTDFLIGGIDGSPDAVNTVATHNPPMDFTVAEPFTYSEWAAADLMARKKAGKSLWAGADKMPSTLITADNVQKYLGQGGDPFPAPAGDWQGAFRKLWGKS